MSFIPNTRKSILLMVSASLKILSHYLLHSCNKSELTKVENRARSNDDTQYHLIQVSVHILVLPRENIFWNKNIWLPVAKISVELWWSHRSWCYCLNSTMVLNCVRVSSLKSNNNILSVTLGTNTFFLWCTHNRYLEFSLVHSL